MKKMKTKIELELVYTVGKSNLSTGVFCEGVESPKQLSGLRVWVDRADDSKKDIINIGGSRPALMELGKYLIALSRFRNKDAGYHDHLDDIQSGVSPSETCDMIIHSPTRFTFARKAKQQNGASQ